MDITYIGGKCHESEKIVDQLRDLGNEVKYLNIGRRELENAINICPQNPLDYLETLKHVQEADVVFGYSMPRAGILAYLASKKLSDTPFIISYTGASWRDYARGNVIFTKYYPIKRVSIPLAERFLIKKADAVATLSPFIKQLFKEDFDKEELYSFRGGIVAEYVNSQLNNERPALMENLESAIVTACPLNLKGKIEGLKILVDAMEKVDTNLVILGDGQFFSDLKDYVDSKDHSEKIHLTGWVDNPEDYIKNSEFLVYCSFEDAYSRPPLEAQSLGKAAIVSKTCSVKETVADGETGFVVEPSADEFADKIRYLLDNPEEAENMGEAGEEFIRKNFNFRNVAKDLQEIFEKVA